MSRSVLPGITVYHCEFTVQSMLDSEKRNGESAASGAVRPAYESLSTVIWAAMSRSQRVFSVTDSVWSETTWKTVGMCTLPLGRRGASLMTPYAFASFVE